MTRTPVLNTIERALILALALSLAAVSVVCEVMLFTSQTNDRLDMALAGIIGFALVGFQYLFATTASKLWQTRQRVFATMLFAVATILFAVSVSGTVGFFESRYQTNQTTQVQSSDAYQQQTALINDLAKQEQTLTKAANASSDQGNNWNAGQLLAKAEQANEQRRKALAELASLETPTNNTASAIAGLAGQHRWLFWLVLAVLVDVCPVFAFAVYAIPAQSKQTTNNKQISNKPLTNKQEQTNSQQTNRLQTEPTNRRRKPNPSVAEIKAQISTLDVPKLGVRLVMDRLAVTNYQRTKQALVELETEGVLVPEGKGYRFMREVA